MSKNDYNTGYAEGLRDTQARIHEIEAAAVILTALIRLKTHNDNAHYCHDCDFAEVILGDFPQAVKTRLEREKVLEEVARHAQTVMTYLEQHGAAIVPHLMDDDDNPGEYLRGALRALEEMTKPAS